MKFFRFLKRHWVVLFVYPLVAALLFVGSCGLLNYLLVPAPNTSIVETVMSEAKRETENIDILFLGSSRTYRGVNAYDLSNNLGKNVFNIAYESPSYLTSYYLLEEVCKKHQPEKVFIEVSTANFLRNKSSQDIYAYQTMTGKAKKDFLKNSTLNYNNFHLLKFVNYMENFSNEKFIQNIEIKAQKNYFVEDSGKSEYYGKGFWAMNRDVSKKRPLVLPASYGSLQKWEEDAVSKVQFEYFEKILDFCQDRQIDVVLYNLPHPLSVTKEAEGAFSEFDLYAKTKLLRDGMKYIDFAKTKKSITTFDEQYFYNANHCNKKGAEALVPILTSVINDLQNGVYDATNYFYSTFEEMIEDYDGE